jgi:hypothetical protein
MLMDPWSGVLDLTRERTGRHFEAGEELQPHELQGALDAIEPKPRRVRRVDNGHGVHTLELQFPSMPPSKLSAVEAASFDFAWRAVTSRLSAARPGQVELEYLWCHRLLVNEDDATVEQFPALAYGRQIRLSNGASALVSNGLSAIFRAGEDHIDAIVLGLGQANVAWVLVDDTSRACFSLMERVRSSTNVDVYDDTLEELSVSARKAQEAIRLIRSRLADAEGLAFDAAISIWGLERELDGLVSHADATLMVVRINIEKQIHRKDLWRNYLLFALSFTGLTQLAISGFELLTGSSASIGPMPRVYFFFGTVVSTFVALSVASAIGWTRHRATVRRRRVSRPDPPPRRPPPRW